MCHCPVLELSRWRLFSPEVPSVVTVMAAVMSPGGSNHGLNPGWIRPRVETTVGFFWMETTTTEKKLALIFHH